MKIVSLVLVAVFLISGAQAGPDKADLLDYLAAKIADTPHNTTPYLRRAHTLAELGLWETAFADLAQVERIGDHATAALVKGDFYSRQGQWRQAEHALNTAIGKDPNNLRAYLLRAQVYDSLGEKSNALADYTRLFSLQPDIESGFYRRAAELTEALQGPTAALELLDQRIQVTGPIPQLQNLAIDIERRRKNFSSAVTRMQTLDPLMQGSPFWHSEIAELYRLNGNTDSARRHLQIAQELADGRRQSRVIRQLKADLLTLAEKLAET